MLPGYRRYEYDGLDGCVITFPMLGGIFGVGRLATKMKGLADTEHIGPWHIGQWTDFKQNPNAIRLYCGW